VRTVLAAGAGALAVLVPSYLWFGPPAVAVLFYRDAGATSDNFYQLFSRPFGLARPPDLLLVAVLLLVAAGWLLLRRLPDGAPGWPAIRPALALSLAWLLVWPFQRPWYDAMVFCLLALFPASRLDWPVLARLGAGTLYSMPGMPGPLPAVFFGLLPVEQRLLVPLIRLAALLAVMALCLTGAWQPRRRTGPPRRWGRRLLSARTPAGTAPARAAYAPADALPAPGNRATGRPGTRRPGRG